MRKILSIFLVICLFASLVFCLPVPAAAEAESEGTEATTPDATTPDATTPEETTPEETTPEETTPEETTPEETTPEETTPDGDGTAGESSGAWNEIFNKWSEEGLPAPIAALLTAYDIFEVATVNLAKSVYRALDYIVAYFEAMFYMA